VDTPSGLLILSGWDGVRPHSDVAPDQDQALTEQLLATGATVEQFVGRALVETNGH
jgi:hypothetical protein